MSMTECFNGALQPGDLVLSLPDDDYACLVGTVLEINKAGTPEHDVETDNPGDDVHVNFYREDYSDNRIAEIENMFSELYGEEKGFEDCPIDDAIMSPENLIRITGIEHEKLKEILESYENAAALCKSVLRVRELTDRLDQNLGDFRDSLLLLDKEDIIDEAGMASAMSDTHYYLTTSHEFEDAEVDYLLLFQNPLEVVADKWYERVGQLDDFTFALDEVFSKKTAIDAGYPLYKEQIPPEPFADISANIKDAARYEASRLLYELRKLSKPNNPDKTEYMAKVSPDFIRVAGSSYDNELFRSFHPPMPMTFGGGTERGGVYLSMTGGVRSSIKVVKPSIVEQLREAADKAARQPQRQRHEQGRSDPSL